MANQILMPYYHSIYQISVPPSSFQVIDLLVMTLYPSVSIVLGLPWLRYTNPDVELDSTSDPFRLGSPSSGASSRTVPFIS